MLFILIPAPAPALSSNNELFEQFMKAYLKNQNQAPLPHLIQAELWE